MRHLYCILLLSTVQLLVTSSPSHGLPKSTQNMKEIELINKIAKQNDVHKKRVIAYPVSAPAKHTNIKTKKIKMMKENQRKLQKRINSENKLEKIIVDELHKESIRKVKHDTKDAINQIANIHQETDAINRKRELLELLQNMIKMHLQTTEPPTPAPTVKFSETIPMLINITGSPHEKPPAIQRTQLLMNKHSNETGNVTVQIDSIVDKSKLPRPPHGRNGSIIVKQHFNMDELIHNFSRSGNGPMYTHVGNSSAGMESIIQVRVQKQKNPVAEHLNSTVPPTPASAPVIVHVDNPVLLIVLVVLISLILAVIVGITIGLCLCYVYAHRERKKSEKTPEKTAARKGEKKCP